MVTKWKTFNMRLLYTFLVFFPFARFLCLLLCTESRTVSFEGKIQISIMDQFNVFLLQYNTIPELTSLSEIWCTVTPKKKARIKFNFKEHFCSTGKKIIIPIWILINETFWNFSAFLCWRVRAKRIVFSICNGLLVGCNWNGWWWRWRRRRTGEVA